MNDTTKFHRDGTLPENDEIFVFGSNLAGAHGAGAARVALEQYGAIFGVGTGFMGKAYAIPTKDSRIVTLPLPEIHQYVKRFIELATEYPHLSFFVTSVGCGLAGYQPYNIAPMFKDAPSNCNFPDTWRVYLL